MEKIIWWFQCHPTAALLERRCDVVLAKRVKPKQVDWGPSMEAVARASAENPTADVRLPLAVDGVPSPETEHAARRRDLRILYPEQE